jgi:formylglycine-generating enzyme
VSMHQRYRSAWLIGAALILYANLTHASVTIDLVTVGDAGNAPKTVAGLGPVGAVDYSYGIGKYEVTNAQYAEFLNAKAELKGPHKLWNQNTAIARTGRGTARRPYEYVVASADAQKPVVGVSFSSAARFANWMSNGQGAGDTEIGSYTGLGTRGFARTPGATWVLPTENEWFKAAFYTGVGDDYSLYATGSIGARPNTYLSSQLPTSDPNSANYWPRSTRESQSPHIGGVTPVGSYAAPSHYGTYDQAGNAWELTDTWSSVGQSHIQRGGAFCRGMDETYLQSTSLNDRLAWSDALAGCSTGFRLACEMAVASDTIVVGDIAVAGAVPAVPEPTSVFVWAGLGALAWLWTRRRAKAGQ